MKPAFKNFFKNFRVTPDLILRCIGYLIIIAYAVVISFGYKMFDPMSVFWRSFNIFGKAGEVQPAIRILSYTVFLLSASWVFRFVFLKISLLFKRGKAVIDIICSLVKYAAVIVLIFFILKTLGVDTTTILAGIGILGLIVGLGAQPLIADIIAGLFIVFEKVFDVGDIIVVDGFRGTVKDIGIRTTQIVDAGGNVKIVNNSDVRTVVNMTNQLSVAICDIGIEYGESLERVEAVLKDALPAIKEAIPDIQEGPFYKGVAELGNSAVIIRFVAKCEEGARYQVERDLNRQFKLLFDKNDINIPFPQVVVNQPHEFTDATGKQQDAASEFIQEQKELSQGLADADPNSLH